MLTAFSTFTGIGGFELGFLQAGIPLKWVGCSEINKFADRIYKYHFSHRNYGDITTINTKKLPDFDLLTGGFPCQSFSTLGQRRGFDDPRGLLFFEMARIIRAKKPQFLLLENVKGLVSHDRGQTFQTIVQTLTALGYGLEWQVLNSKDFGVPQQRERIFLVGCFGKKTGCQVFPLSGQDSTNAPIPSGEPVAVMTPQKSTLRTSCRRFKQPGEPMFTLTASDKHGIFDGNRIRVLTPLECERLQGFPDHWTKFGRIGNEVVEMSDMQRYKCLGNAVTVNVVAAIVKKMFEHLSNAAEP